MKKFFSKQCLILAGGYGSRLGKVTKKIPKPLIKVNNKPFVSYIIKNLYRQGIRDFIILSYYKNFLFQKKIFKKFRDANIRLIKEKKKLGTLGSIINSKNHLRNSFFVVNGDSFFDFNIRDFEFNLFKKKKNIGVALTKIKNSQNKISFEIKKGKLIKIQESKKKEKYVCGGLYYFNKKVINKFPLKNLDIDKDLILKIDYKKFLYTKYYDSNFLDIGTPKDLKKSSNFIKKNLLKPCAFLDRDGVINHDLGYVCSKKRTKWKKNIFKTIKYLNDNNYRVIIITNQAGIAKGYYTLKEFIKYTNWFHNQFLFKGSFIDQTYFSPFHPDGKIKEYKKKSNLRKPSNGMIVKAFKDWEIIKKKSFLIGDNQIDLAAGKKSGIRSFLVKKDILSQIKKITKNT